MDAPLQAIRAEVARMTESLFGLVGIPFGNTTELQRQLLAAFAFGMTFAVGQMRKLSPPDVHAITIAYLMDVFRYPDHQAATFANDLIAAAQNEDHHPTINAIIHRGIDGHAQWERGNHDDLRTNINDIFKRVGA